jgi:hypothetical protein
MLAELTGKAAALVVRPVRPAKAERSRWEVLRATLAQTPEARQAQQLAARPAQVEPTRPVARLPPRATVARPESTSRLVLRARYQRMIRPSISSEHQLFARPLLTLSGVRSSRRATR